jgi:type IV secretion system protein VirB8
VNPPIRFKNQFKRLSFQEEAYDWYADRYESIYVSRNRWLVTALTSLILAALQAGALLCLVPLKTSVPFLVKEEASGAITTVTRLAGNGSITYDEAVRKFFLGRYLSQRETYDPVDLADNYRAVDLMSDQAESRAFKEAISSSNRSSPVIVYGNQARRLIRMKSIVFLNDHTAQIRFTATVQRSASLPQPSDWIATVAFRFGPPPSLEADRLVNPLGFAVTHYRIDQEVVP